MQETRFDALARSLGAQRSRRALLQRAGVALLGAVAAGVLQRPPRGQAEFGCPPGMVPTDNPAMPCRPSGGTGTGSTGPFSDRPAGSGPGPSGPFSDRPPSQTALTSSNGPCPQGTVSLGGNTCCPQGFVAGGTCCAPNAQYCALAGSNCVVGTPCTGAGRGCCPSTLNGGSFVCLGGNTCCPQENVTGDTCCAPIAADCAIAGPNCQVGKVCGTGAKAHCCPTDAGFVCVNGDACCPTAWVTGDHCCAPTATDCGNVGPSCQVGTVCGTSNSGKPFCCESSSYTCVGGDSCCPNAFITNGQCCAPNADNCAAVGGSHCTVGTVCGNPNGPFCCAAGQTCSTDNKGCCPPGRSGVYCFGDCCPSGQTCNGGMCQAGGTCGPNAIMCSGQCCTPPGSGGPYHLPCCTSNQLPNCSCPGPCGYVTDLHPGDHAICCCDS